MMLQYSQTANPQSRLGMEIQRLRVAIFLPVDSQNASSSGSQVWMSAMAALSILV